MPTTGRNKNTTGNGAGSGANTDNEGRNAHAYLSFARKSLILSVNASAGINLPWHGNGYSITNASDTEIGILSQMQVNP